MKYSIEPTTQDHIDELALTMRQADIDECWAFAHYTPAQALAASIPYTHKPTTGLADGAVVCIQGVAKTSYLSKIGIPWMLTSPLIEEHSKKFLRSSIDVLRDMKTEAVILANVVDIRNYMTLEWLQWIGFTLGDAIRIGPDNRLFYPFVMEGDK